MKKSLIVYVLLLAFLAGAVSYGLTLKAKYQDTLTNIAAEPEEQSEELPEETIEEAEPDPFALLLFGISNREALNDPGTADTIMLALVNPADGQVSLISVPRDAYVEIPGYGQGKINAAYPRGGADLLIKTLENLFDMDIHGFASINFQGFIDLVDLVDGIKVNVPRDMQYDDPVDGTHIDLQKGEQVLYGKNALDFVRFRKSNDGRHASDYDRMERQQQALTELSGKLSSIRMITRVYRILDIVSANVETSLTVDELDLLVKKFYSLDLQSLQTTSLQGGGYLINGAWYEIVPEEEIERLRELIRTFMGDSEEC